MASLISCVYLTAQALSSNEVSGSGSTAVRSACHVAMADRRRNRCYHAAASADGVPEEASASSRPGANPVPSDTVRYRSRLEQLYVCGSSMPEEKIQPPQSLSTMPARDIGNNTACSQCKQLGLVECATCQASGLYVEPILESQGIIVKVRCMGCGGSGSIMCLRCGGRGHV